MFVIDKNEYREYFEYIESKYNFKLLDDNKQTIFKFETDEEIDLDKYLQVIQIGLETIIQFHQLITTIFNNIKLIEYNLIDFMIDNYTLTIHLIDNDERITIKNYKIDTDKYDKLKLLLYSEKIKNEIINQKQTICNRT